MTADNVPWFRELYDELLDYNRLTPFQDVLTPWIERAQLAVADLARFQTPVAYDSKNEKAQFSMWNLYALSRVNDLLIASFQPNQFHEKRLSLSRWEYETFFSDIGLSICESPSFSPLYDEIAMVEQSPDDDEPIQTYERYWPGLMLGNLVFSRSGVGVIGGRRHVIKEKAEKSTLYFTHRRFGRSTNDLSMGWGHNSQWRTSIRRDYFVDSRCIFNLDGSNLLKPGSDVSEDGDGLTVSERIELCKHRCFIITDKEDHDLWPFDDRYEEVCT